MDVAAVLVKYGGDVTAAAKAILAQAGEGKKQRTGKSSRRDVTLESVFKSKKITQADVDTIEAIVRDRETLEEDDWIEFQIQFNYYVTEPHKLIFESQEVRDRYEYVLQAFAIAAEESELILSIEQNIIGPSEITPQPTVWAPSKPSVPDEPMPPASDKGTLTKRETIMVKRLIAQKFFNIYIDVDTGEIYRNRLFQLGKPSFIRIAEWLDKDELDKDLLGQIMKAANQEVQRIKKDFYPSKNVDEMAWTGPPQDFYEVTPAELAKIDQFDTEGLPKFVVRQQKPESEEEEEVPYDLSRSQPAGRPSLVDLTSEDVSSSRKRPLFDPYAGFVSEEEEEKPVRQQQQRPESPQKKFDVLNDTLKNAIRYWTATKLFNCNKDMLYENSKTLHVFLAKALNLNSKDPNVLKTLGNLILAARNTIKLKTNANRSISEIIMGRNPKKPLWLPARDMKKKMDAILVPSDVESSPGVKKGEIKDIKPCLGVNLVDTPGVEMELHEEFGSLTGTPEEPPEEPASFQFTRLEPVYIVTTKIFARGDDTSVDYDVDYLIDFVYENLDDPGDRETWDREFKNAMSYAYSERWDVLADAARRLRDPVRQRAIDEVLDEFDADEEATGEDVADYSKYAIVPWVDPRFQSDYDFDDDDDFLDDDDVLLDEAFEIGEIPIPLIAFESPQPKETPMLLLGYGTAEEEEEPKVAPFPVFVPPQQLLLGYGAAEEEEPKVAPNDIVRYFVASHLMNDDGTVKVKEVTADTLEIIRNVSKLESSDKTLRGLINRTKTQLKGTRNPKAKYAEKIPPSIRKQVDAIRLPERAEESPFYPGGPADLSTTEVAKIRANDEVGDIYNQVEQMANRRYGKNRPIFVKPDGTTPVFGSQAEDAAEQFELFVLLYLVGRGCNVRIDECPRLKQIYRTIDENATPVLDSIETMRAGFETRVTNIFNDGIWVHFSKYGTKDFIPSFSGKIYPELFYSANPLALFPFPNFKDDVGRIFGFEREKLVNKVQRLKTNFFRKKPLQKVNYILKFIHKDNFRSRKTDDPYATRDELVSIGVVSPDSGDVFSWNNQRFWEKIFKQLQSALELQKALREEFAAITVGTDLDDLWDIMESKIRAYSNSPQRHNLIFDVSHVPFETKVFNQIVGSVENEIRNEFGEKGEQEVGYHPLKNVVGKDAFPEPAKMRNQPQDSSESEAKFAQALIRAQGDVALAAQIILQNGRV